MFRFISNDHRQNFIGEVKSPSVKISTKKPLQIFNDHLSRLNQFSWEEIEGRCIPVIFRNESNGFGRYTSKIYVETVLFKHASWQKCMSFARNLPPLISFPYTENEMKLFRTIVEWHLASVPLKTIPSTDCLISFEEFLNFYLTLREVRDNISNPQIEIQQTKSFSSNFNFSNLNDQNLPSTIPLVPSPINMTNNNSTQKQAGWLQINHIFLPYLMKRPNESSENTFKDRTILVPYEILIKFRIFSENEFPWKNFLVKASQEDFNVLNSLIMNINIFNEKLTEKTNLVNLYHLMMAFDRILYVKFLPTKNPRTQVNRPHNEIVKIHGGTLMIQNQHLIPYLIENNRFFVPFYYACRFLPNLESFQRCTRAARPTEIDFLNLMLLYFSIDTVPFNPETILIDIFIAKNSLLPTSIHYRTVAEHHLTEKRRLTVLSLSLAKNNRPPASCNSGRATKFQPSQVVINPLINHPSFYGLSSLSVGPSKIICRGKSNLVENDTTNSPSKIRKIPELKIFSFGQREFTAILSCSQIPVDQWKISVRQIFERFQYKINYSIFIRWIQSNGLIPLVELENDEKRLISSTYDDDFYINHQHFERCIDLLNNLERDSISIAIDNRKLNDKETDENLSRPRDERVRSNSLTISTFDEMNDDDKMPVVASVEEEQTIDELNFSSSCQSPVSDKNVQLKEEKLFPSASQSPIFVKNSNSNEDRSFSSTSQNSISVKNSKTNDEKKFSSNSQIPVVVRSSNTEKNFPSTSHPEILVKNSKTNDEKKFSSTSQSQIFVRNSKSNDEKNFSHNSPSPIFVKSSKLNDEKSFSSTSRNSIFRQNSKSKEEKSSTKNSQNRSSVRNPKSNDEKNSSNCQVSIFVANGESNDEKIEFSDRLTSNNSENEENKTKPNRSRSPSLNSKNFKKIRTENEEKQNKMKTIENEMIEQILRTLFDTKNEKITRRTRSSRISLRFPE